MSAGALPDRAIAGAALAPSAGLTVAVSGLRSQRGTVLMCLTANPRFFPNCERDPGAIKRTVAAADAASVHFAGLVPGTYALGLIHDENANNRLDVAVFVPREGFGFSRNPKISFGPPKFGAASFAIGTGECEQKVAMKYML